MDDSGRRFKVNPEWKWLHYLMKNGCGKWVTCNMGPVENRIPLKQGLKCIKVGVGDQGPVEERIPLKSYATLIFDFLTQLMYLIIHETNTHKILV